MIYLHQLSFIFLSLALAFGFTGCQQQQEGPAEKAGKQIDQAAQQAGEKMGEAKEALSKKTEQAGAYMDDASITAKVKADILADPLLKVSQITVTTTNGVVRLSGVVDSPQSIERSKEIGRAVKGVKSVESELIVKPAR